jgi:hypothetical protein
MSGTIHALLKRFVFVATLFHFCSCSHKYVGYVTSTQNIPLLVERNEGRGMVAVGLNHVEGQVSFSPIKHIALMGNTYHGKNGMSTELGGGLYASTKSGFVFEAYALRIQADMNRNTQRIISFLSQYVDAEFQSLNAHYDGYSGQFDIGYKIPSSDQFNASIGIGVKYSRVNYSNFNYDYKYYIHWEDSGEQLQTHHKINLENVEVNFLSLSPTMRVGSGPLQLFMQYSTHISMEKYEPNYETFPFYRKSWLTIGFELHLNKAIIEGKSNAVSR